MEPQLVDCHSHTAYSGHGEGSIHDAVLRAQELGLAVYAQTEHLTLPQEMDPNREDSMSPQDAQRYLQELHSEQARLQLEGSPLELVAGIEADWLPGRAQELQELCAPYDYVVGSVHFVDGLPLDNEDNMVLWESRDVDAVWEAYLEAMEQMLMHAPIHCAAHPDLPKLFGQRPSFNLRDAFGDLAGIMRERGILMELNTAGWRKPVGEQYPATSLLALFSDQNVECTVGCDAHKPQQIGYKLHEAYAALYASGFRRIRCPHKGTAQEGTFTAVALV